MPMEPYLDGILGAGCGFLVDCERGATFGRMIVGLLTFSKLVLVVALLLLFESPNTSSRSR